MTAPIFPPTAPVPGAQAGKPPAFPSEVPPYVRWAFDNVGPPAPYFVTKDDAILWFSQVSAGQQGNGFAVSMLLVARILLLDGSIKRISEVQTTGGGQAQIFKTIRLPVGFLLSLAVINLNVFAQGASAWNVVYISNTAGSGTDIRAVLCQGYAGFIHPVFWPGGANNNSTDGNGRPYHAIGGIPGAGTDIAFQLNAGQRWKLRAFSASLTTRATVANRTPELSIIDLQGNVYSRTGPAAAQVAGTTVRYCWIGTGASFVDAAGTSICPIPPDMLLQVQDSINTVTGNLQVGDQWTAPKIWVEEWMDN